MKNAVRPLFLLLAIAFAALFYAFVRESQPDLSFHFNPAVELNEGWTLQREDGSSQPISLPNYVDMAPGEEMRLLADLPGRVYPSESLLIRGSMQSLKVVCEGRLLYEYGTDPGLFFGKNPGSAWHIVPIPADYAGGRVALIFSSPFERGAGTVNSVFYGTKNDLLLHVARCHGLSLLGALGTFAIGAMTMLLGFFRRVPAMRRRELIHLGIFSIMVSIWLLGESRMAQFIAGNRLFISTVSYAALMLMPLPLLLYLDSAYTPSHMRYAPWMFWLFALNFAVAMALQMLGIRDFFEVVNVLHVLLILLMVLIMASLIYESSARKNPEARKLLLSMAILVFFGALELLDFYFNPMASVSRWLRLGFFLYVLALGGVSLSKIQRALQEAQDARHLEVLAYSDALTRGNNRAAYYRDIERLLSERKRFFLAYLDLNDLKGINDSHGHAAGDEAICAVMRCMNEAFSPGCCYRIGGDEFACLYIGAADAFERDVARFRHLIESVASSHRYPLAIALGYVNHDPADLVSFDQLSSAADRLMYLDKSRLKQAISATNA